MDVVGYVFGKKVERRKRGTKWMELGFGCWGMRRSDQRRPKRIKSVVSGRLESVRSTGVLCTIPYNLMTSLTGGGSKEFGDFSF